MPAPRSLIAALAAATAAVAVVAPASADVTAPHSDSSDHSAAHAAAKSRIEYAQWGRATVKRGTFAGTKANAQGIVLGRHLRSVRYRDPHGHGPAVAYRMGRWYSPWHRPGFNLTELIASYNAATPPGTFIEISVRGRAAARTSSWDSLGRWASHDVNFHRMSLGSQDDDLSSVAVDTLTTDSARGLSAWQLRLSLYRKAGAAKTPAVRMIGAMASRIPSGSQPTSAPGPGGFRDLGVPRYSQEIHAGEYPQWNGGGEAWCSPTSTAMVLGFFNRGPTPRQYRWVNDDYEDPWVDYAARYTYASGYDGTGDWPFNTAYAARFSTDAFVTRLRSLREARLFIQAGIPLVASISFGPGELTGAPINSTNGHLLVIRGFTERGRVIVNDPAAPTAATVRRVYQRGQFERAWIGATGGVVYVIHPKAVPLPSPGKHSNW